MQFHAADGQPLYGSLYGEENRDGIVVAAAMSVPRRYYDAFAQFAAARGFAVLLFDYRGFGQSRPPSIRQSKAKMAEWGVLDLPAATEFMVERRRPAGGSLSLVAHSAGGQVAGLAHNLQQFGRMAFVASQSGYWRTWPGWRRYGLYLLWLAMPVVSSILGFFPSRLLGLGSENLPRLVAKQWAQWGRHPKYVLGFGHELDTRNYRAWKGPLMAWSFAGDNYAPPLAVEALLAEYSSATIERRPVHDAAVGHFGYFRRGNEALWNEALDFLRPDPGTRSSAGVEPSSPVQASSSAPPR
ncbi:MAG TPA: alpha/beta fold hydrolase [Thermoanaerobaculia bacterium]|nr:alpha/beta fold hydrolase [Thermoanaerobaculia bacterium]